MNDSEALIAIGRLIVKARVELGLSQLGFSNEMGVTPKTVASMEQGRRLMNDVTRYKVEKTLHWREGAISQVWNDRENLSADQLDIADMKLGADNETWEDLAAEHQDAPVTRASQLSDEELLAEITYRFRNYKLERNGES